MTGTLGRGAARLATISPPAIGSKAVSSFSVHRLPIVTDRI
jgi:hypothetical protein